MMSRELLGRFLTGELALTLDLNFFYHTIRRSNICVDRRLMCSAPYIQRYGSA